MRLGSHAWSADTGVNAGAADDAALALRSGGLSSTDGIARRGLALRLAIVGILGALCLLEPGARVRATLEKAISAATSAPKLTPDQRFASILRLAELMQRDASQL